MRGDVQRREAALQRETALSTEIASHKTTSLARTRSWEPLAHKRVVSSLSRTLPYSNLKASWDFGAASAYWFGINGHKRCWTRVIALRISNIDDMFPSSFFFF